MASSADDSELLRLFRAKHVDSAAAAPLGPEMIGFFERSVQKRQTKLLHIAARWSQLVPQTLSDHCALEAFSRGTLTVLVDSASHLYELKQLLLAGTQQQLLLACRSASLRKIVLRPGRWYEPSADASRKLRFD